MTVCDCEGRGPVTSVQILRQISPPWPACTPCTSFLSCLAFAYRRYIALKLETISVGEVFVTSLAVTEWWAVLAGQAACEPVERLTAQCCTAGTRRSLEMASDQKPEIHMLAASSELTRT